MDDRTVHARLEAAEIENKALRREVEELRLKARLLDLRD